MHVVLLRNCVHSVLVHSCSYYSNHNCTLYSNSVAWLYKFATCRLAIANVPKVLHYSASLYQGMNLIWNQTVMYYTCICTIVTYYVCVLILVEGGLCSG